METVRIDGTERTPEIDFNFAKGCLVIKGESYPEDAAAFYGPLLSRLQEFLAAAGGAEITVDVAMEYFNSSSAKALMNMFQMFEEAAAADVTVTINWYYQEDDDMMQEFGEDFSEDLECVTFRILRSQS